LEFYNNGSGSGANFDLFFGEMSHVIAATGSGISETNVVVTSIPSATTDGIADAWWDKFNISVRSATNDPDGDGLANLVEYGLGGNPTNANGNLVTAATSTNINGTNWWRFGFRARTNDAALAIQPVFKGSLTDADWSTNGVIQKVSGTPVGDGEHEDQLWQTPMDGADRKFLRLRVTK
jgi:hypothetical protein